MEYDMMTDAELVWEGMKILLQIGIGLVSILNLIYYIAPYGDREDKDEWSPPGAE